MVECVLQFITSPIFRATLEAPAMSRVFLEHLLYAEHQRDFNVLLVSLQPPSIGKSTLSVSRAALGKVLGGVGAHTVPGQKS